MTVVPPFTYILAVMVLLWSEGGAGDSSTTASPLRASDLSRSLRGEAAGHTHLWGNEVNGLQTSIIGDKLEFKHGEPILVRCLIKNTGNRVQTVPHSGFWPDYKLIVKSAEGIELPLTEMGQETRAAFGGTTKRRKSFDVRLGPGEVDEHGSYDIRDYFCIEGAEILRVQCLYAHGSLKVWSNELLLRVR